MSAVGAVRSSVSENAVAKATQVGDRLRSLPNWVQSGANVAKDLVKAATSRVATMRALALEKAPQAAAEKLQAPLDSAVSVAENMTSPTDDSLALGAGTGVLEHVGTTSDELLPTWEAMQGQVDEVNAQVDHTEYLPESVDSLYPSEEMQEQVDQVEECLADTIEEVTTHEESEEFPSGAYEEAVCANVAVNAADLQDESSDCVEAQDAEVVLSEEHELASFDEMSFVEEDIVQQNPVDEEFASFEDDITAPSFLGDEEVETGFDPSSFATEEPPTSSAAFAANQAADIDYIVDSQGVEWFPVHDDNTGFVYYWNQRTGETSWTRPVTSAEAAFGA